jgi:hypothetical protein
MENTPTIKLPKEAKADIVAVTFAGAAISGTAMNPTVALYHMFRYMPDRGWRWNGRE